MNEYGEDWRGNAPANNDWLNSLLKEKQLPVFNKSSKPDPFAERQKEIENRLTNPSWVKPNLGDSKYMNEKFPDTRFDDEWADNAVRSMKAAYVLRGWESINKEHYSISSENKIVRNLLGNEKVYTIWGRFTPNGSWFKRMIIWADRDLTAVYNRIGRDLKVSKLESEADSALTAMATAIENAQKAVDALKLEKGK